MGFKAVSCTIESRGDGERDVTASKKGFNALVSDGSTDTVSNVVRENVRISFGKLQLLGICHDVSESKSIPYIRIHKNCNYIEIVPIKVNPRVFLTRVYST